MTTEQHKQVSIDDIEALPKSVSETPNKGYLEECNDLDLAKKRVLLDDYTSTVEARNKMSPWILKVTTGWLVMVVAVVLMQGFTYNGFYLDNIVLSVVVGSSTVNVIGLLVIVLNFLYHDKPFEK